MKPTLLLLLAVVLISFNSCKKKENNNNLVSVDSMVLQYNGGFAPQVIYHAYLIGNGTVMEDTTSPITQEHPNMFNKELSADTYQSVADLLNEVPETLLNQNNTRFDTGKYPDGSSTTVKVYMGGVEYQWYFDSYTDEMIEPAKTFADNVFGAVHGHLINK